MKKEEKYIVMRDRPSMLSPVYWNCIVQTSPEVKNLYGINTTYEWMKFYRKNGYPYEASFYPKNNFDQIGRYVTGKILKDKKYFSRIEARAEEKKKAALAYLEKIEKENLENLKFQGLMREAKKIQKAWIDYDSCTVQMWFIAGDVIKETIKEKINIPEDDFVFLADPLEKTHTSRFDEVLVKSILHIKKYEHRLKKVAARLSRDFGWLPFGYDGPEYWDIDYFILKLKEGLRMRETALISKAREMKERDRVIRKKYRDLIKKYQFNPEEKRLIAIVQTMAIWTDERKALDHRLNYHYARILKELGGRYDIPFLNLKFLLTEELPEILMDKKAVINKTNQRIGHPFIVEYRNGRGGVLTEKEGAKIIKELDGQIFSSDEIKGAVACRGNKEKYEGRVKVLYSAKESAKVEEDDFLVAVMTTPDYIMAMRKAAGFITDEGGVTCHAAIVAREMNKPCVIGTRNATKVLRDGDIIQMDTAQGTIKIVKNGRKNDQKN